VTDNLKTTTTTPTTLSATTTAKETKIKKNHDLI